jgi:hypothetical protein
MIPLIQQDIDRLAQWSDKWKLNFKARTSCEVIFHFSRRHLGHDPPQFIYKWTKYLKPLLMNTSEWSQCSSLLGARYDVAQTKQ